MLLLATLLIGTVPLFNAAAADGGENGLHGLDRELQAIKHEAVDLGQALLELEEAVLYPRDLQLIIFVSLSPKSTIRPETTQVKLNGDVVAEQAYNDEEIAALRGGDVQRLYTGRLPYGKHRLVASLEGLSKTGKRYRRQITAALLKGPGPKYVELGVGAADSAHLGVGATTRVPDLVGGEIRSLKQQQDYLSAIARLRLAQQRALLPDDGQSGAVLLAELLLDYGLHQAAASVLRGMQESGAPESVRNRGWHLLAKVLFHKGYLDTAKAALGQITGQVLQDLRGDHQLLQAHVLMALDLNQDAAKALRRWHGPRDQAGYAHYNRGVALMRAGDYEGAMDALGKVIDSQADGEELLALNDKANLALGNLSLEMNDVERAQAYFESVRLQGPFSNRALLGAGWAALERDQKEEALTPWLELRRRAIIDLAVQEALLTVPAVQRQLRSLTTAARSYEEAVVSFASELQRLDAAIDAVRESGVMRSRHSHDQRDPPGLTGVSAPLGSSVAAAVAPEGRYFGQLLAGHEFQEAWRGYRDLLSLDETLSEWLQRLDALDDYRPPTLQANALPTARDSSPPTGRAQANHDNVSAKPGKPVATEERSLSPSGTAVLEQWVPGTRAGGRSEQRRATPLPEVELPPERAVNPLPRSQFSGAPTASEVIWLPSTPEVLWLPPKPGVKWLPSADGARLPNGGSVRLPQPDDEQSPHPEFTARESAPTEGQGSPARRVLREVPQASVARAPSATGEPNDNAVLTPPATMASAAPQAKQPGRALEATPRDSEQFGERIAALRARILALRPWIASALKAHTGYLNALALRDLEGRRNRLQSFLEQAQLELAKTYDDFATTK